MRVTRLQLVGRYFSARERIKWNANLSQNARGEMNPGSKKRLETQWWTEEGRLGAAQRAAVGPELRTLRFGSAVWPLSRPSSGVWAVYLAPTSLLLSPDSCDSCVSPSPSQYDNLVFLSSRTTLPLLLPCYPRRMGLSQLLQLSVFVPAIYSFISAWKLQFRRF